MESLICPRCDSRQTAKIADSPVKGVFEIYKCKHCNFVWRSTEDLSQLDKLRPEDMANAIDLRYL